MEINIMEEFEQDLALYDKYLDTVKIIIALKDYREACRERDISHMPSTIIDYFAEKVIANLEDHNVKINCEDNISNLIKKFSSLKNKIKNKYKGIIDEEILSSKLDSECIITNHSNDERKYKIITDVKDEEWERKMITSNIPLPQRQNMFIDLIEKYGDNIGLFISAFDKDADFRELYNSMKTTQFTKKFLKRSDVLFFEKLFDLGLVRVYSTIIEDALKDEGAYYYIPLLREIYNSAEYQEKASKSQKKQDIINIIEIIPAGGDLESANDVMKFNFEVDEDVFDAFAKIIISSWNGLYEPDKTRKDIARKLIRKVKNDKDKKRLLEYRDKFLEETDVEGKIRKEIEERRRQKLVLKASRQELTSLLHNLNETIQETTPGKRLLKEIDFKKLS